MSSNGINEIKKFLANYGTKWIKDADTNKDSAVTKNEFSHFIQTNYNGKISASEINAFFDTLDVNKGNGCARGTNVSNYGALDKDETEVMQKYIEMFDKVKNWLNQQNLPADIANDVKNALLDKMSECTTAEELQGLMNENNLNRLINETYANKYVNEYLKELFLNTASQYEDLVSLGKYAYADDPELVAIYSQIIYDASNTTERLNPQDLKNQIRTAIKAYVDTIIETGESGARIELNAIQKANITLTAIRDSYDTVYDEDGNAYVLTDPKYSKILNKYQKLFTDRLCSNSERKTYAELMAEARNFENSQECKDMIAEIKAGNNSDGGSDTDSGIIINPTWPGDGSFSKPLLPVTDLGFVSFKRTSFTVSQANQTFNNVYSWADDTKDNYINVGGGYSDEVIKFSGGALTVNATALNAGTHTIPVTVKCCNPGESTPIETKTINIKLVVKEAATSVEDEINIDWNKNLLNGLSKQELKNSNIMICNNYQELKNQGYDFTLTDCAPAELSQYLSLSNGIISNLYALFAGITTMNIISSGNFNINLIDNNGKIKKTQTIEFNNEISINETQNRNKNSMKANLNSTLKKSITGNLSTGTLNIPINRNSIANLISNKCNDARANLLNDSWTNTEVDVAITNISFYYSNILDALISSTNYPDRSGSMNTAEYKYNNSSTYTALYGISNSENINLVDYANEMAQTYYSNPEEKSKSCTGMVIVKKGNTFAMSINSAFLISKLENALLKQINHI